MEKMDVSRPISIVLDGNNYNLWVPAMRSFLIGRRLWRYVSGTAVTPTKLKDEDDDEFAQRLEDWDVANHQIITWFYNTSVSDIHVQFDTLQTAKEVWDFLATRFQSTGLAHYFQLWNTLHSQKQAPGQSVNAFLGQIQPIWNQLRQAKISEDHLQLIQILMALRPEYESVRSSLLHRTPLPSLNDAIKEIIFEETRLGLDKPYQTDVALATNRPKPAYQKIGTPFCTNCRQAGHSRLHCPTIECLYCYRLGHIISNCTMRLS